MSLFKNGYADFLNAVVNGAASKTTSNLLQFIKENADLAVKLRGGGFTS